MKTPQYWKDYRIKNLDKLRAYKRAHEKRRRMARRAPAMPHAASETFTPCIVCSKPALRKGWHNGVIVWLCAAHA